MDKPSASALSRRRLLGRAHSLGNRREPSAPQADAHRPDTSWRETPHQHGNGEDSLLTAEELAILQLTADGLPLNAVARRTGMSSRTVRRRLRGLCDRLGVTHPIQAVVWAVRRGLI
jgi:DNA-binding NarL/FixJ family response regulator